MSGLTLLPSSHASIAACGANSARPFHSFGSLGRVLAKVKNFLSLIVTVDPSSYILHVTLSQINREICAGKVVEASIRGSSVSFFCLDVTVPDQFQPGLIHFPHVIRVTSCNHVNSVCPVPQQSGHQSAEDGQPSCHANPTRTANPRCTKLLLRFRQLASQTTRCQSRRIYNRMRNNSRYQVHQCTLSQNRKSQSIKAR